MSDEPTPTLIAALSRFAYQELVIEAKLLGGSVEALLHDACSAYLAELAEPVGDSRARAVPGFLAASAPNDAVEVGLDLNHSAMRQLAREAERQGVSIDLLINHIAIVHLERQDARGPGRGRGARSSHECADRFSGAGFSSVARDRADRSYFA